MKLLQKIFVSATLALGLAISANADSYPSKPIRLIVGTPASGAVDTVGRAIALELKDALKQPVVVENRPGATGMVAAGLVAKSPADGYTLGVVWSSLPSSFAFNERLGFTSRDVTGVFLGSTIGFGFVANANRPYNNFTELIEYAKKNPGKVSIGTSGVGGLGHLAVLMLEQETGAKFLHVPFNGLNNAVLAVLAGDVDIATGEPGRVQQHIDTGKLKYIVNVSEKNMFIEPQYRKIESIADRYPRLRGFQTWVGVIAPAGTPKDVLEKINAALAKGAQDQRYQDTLLRAGVKPLTSTVDEFNSLILNDLGRMHYIRRETGIKIE
jgi:tripartite-type tricarboxylate transporter receptor subunit TctC